MDPSNAPIQRYSLRKCKVPPPELAPKAKVPKAVKPSRDETPATNISDLSDELLGRVIRELEPKERVFSERICRKWNRVSRAYGWLNFCLVADKQWSDEWKESNLPPGHQNGYVTRRTTSVLEELPRVVEKELQCLLSRCAPSVRGIDLSGLEKYGLDGQVCELLTGGMRKLETLKLDHIPLDSSQLAMIGDRVPWLREISLNDCFPLNSQDIDSGLASMLASCRHLESLLLSKNTALNGNPSFSNLPPTLRVLELFACPRIHPSLVDNLLATCAGNLRRLMLWSTKVEEGAFEGWTNAHLERLFTGLAHLEELYFGEFSETGNDDQWQVEGISTRLECVGALKNLRTLVLRCNAAVTSEVLITQCDWPMKCPHSGSVKVLNRIVDGCRELVWLQLCHCDDGAISNEAIGRLAQLSKLTHLTLHWHPSIDDDTLAALARGPARLRELSVFGCKKVTDKGIAHLLEGCGGQLRELDISYCPLVTQATVAKLEALYSNSSESDNKEGAVFVLKAEGTGLGFDHKEFGASRGVE